MRGGCWLPAGVHIPGHAGSIPVLASILTQSQGGRFGRYVKPTETPAFFYFISESVV